MTLDDLRDLTHLGEDGHRHWGHPYEMSPSLEECEFLYALVRCLKPNLVVELGTGRGVTAKFIGCALADNGKGTLHTYEDTDEYAKDARDLLRGLPVAVKDGRGPEKPTPPDLVFVDSGPQRRKQDIARWIERKPPVMVVHDANRRYEALEGWGFLLPAADGLWLGAP